MYKRYLLIILLSLALPFFAHAEVKAGFVEKQIWFSSEPTAVGETTTISTLLHNQANKAVYGSVIFYDNGKSLGTKTATVEAHASKVVSLTWKVTAGNHSIVAKFENTRQVNAQGPETTVSNSSTSPYTFHVDEPTPVIKETDTSSTPDSTSSDATTSGTSSSGTTKGEVSKTVDEVKGAATTTFGKFDDFRQETAVTLSDKADDAKAAVEIIKKEKEGQVAGVSKENEPTAVSIKKSESFVDTPFAYVKMLFYQLAFFIFNHKAVFYGLIILIIILFFRYLVRAPR